MYLIQINLPPPSTISPLYTILRYIDTHPLLYAHKNVQEVPSLDTQTRPLFYNRVNLISRSFSVRICISDKDQLLMFYLLLKNLARLGKLYARVSNQVSSQVQCSCFTHTKYTGLCCHR